MQLSFAQATPQATFSEEEPLEDEDYESLEATEEPPRQQMNIAQNSGQNSGQNSRQNSGQNSGQNSSINVQTNTQPVLIVPMNVSKPAQSQIIQPPVPGAPPTLAFDTSEPVMKNIGLQPSSSRSNSPAPRPRTNSNASNSSSGMNTNTNPNVRVNVVKEG
jgi:hypothetical protein